MPKPVVAYTTQWCPDCTRSRRVLQQTGVPFVEIDIEEIEGAENAMRALNGGSGKVPTVLVGERILIEPSDQELRCALQEHFHSVPPRALE